MVHMISPLYCTVDAPIWGGCAVQVVSVLEGVVDTERSAVAPACRAALQCMHTLCSRDRNGRAELLLLLATQAVELLAVASSGCQQGRYLRGLMSLLASALKLAGSNELRVTQHRLGTCIAAAAMMSVTMLEHVTAQL